MDKMKRITYLSVLLSTRQAQKYVANSCRFYLVFYFLVKSKMVTMFNW